MRKAVHQVNGHVKIWETCGTALQLGLARSSLLVSFVHVSPTQHPPGVFHNTRRFMVSTKPQIRSLVTSRLWVRTPSWASTLYHGYLTHPEVYDIRQTAAQGTSFWASLQALPLLFHSCISIAKTMLSFMLLRVISTSTSRGQGHLTKLFYSQWYSDI